MSRIFISHTRLDDWVTRELAALSGNQLALSEGPTFLLSAAVLFVRVVGAGTDPHDLLGKVKGKQQLASLAAEHYQDSVLIGEVGYQVVEGFIGVPQ